MQVCQPPEISKPAVVDRVWEAWGHTQVCECTASHAKCPDRQVSDKSVSQEKSTASLYCNYGASNIPDVCVYVRARTHVCMCMCVCACMCAHMCAHVLLYRYCMDVCVLVCVCMCACTCAHVLSCRYVHACAAAHMWRLEDILREVVVSYHVGLGSQAW